MVCWRPPQGWFSSCSRLLKSAVREWSAVCFRWVTCFTGLLWGCVMTYSGCCRQEWGVVNDAICAVSTVPCEADVGGETRQDGSLGCSVVAVITVCVYQCGCGTNSWCWWRDKTRWIIGLQCCCCDYGFCVYLCGCDIKKLMLEEIETRQDGSLGCSVVAVITVCLHLCGCDTTRGSHGAVLCVSFNLKNTLNCVWVRVWENSNWNSKRLFYMGCSLGLVKPIVLPELRTSKVTRHHLYIHTNETLMKNDHWSVEHKNLYTKTCVFTTADAHKVCMCTVYTSLSYACISMKFADSPIELINSYKLINSFTLLINSYKLLLLIMEKKTEAVNA